MAMWVSLLPYLVIAVAVVVFFILMISVSLLEKQYIRHWEAVLLKDLGDTSSYFNAMNQAASSYGYECHGTYTRAQKSAVSQTYMAAWLSPDKATLACVMGGKVAKVNYRKSFLISQVESDKFFLTRDDFGELDHSGTKQIEVVLNADFSELAARHVERLNTTTTLRLIAPREILQFLESLEELQARKLILMRLARFFDEPNGVWRYNFKGGWMNFWSVTTQMKAAKLQLDRSKKKRPGS